VAVGGTVGIGGVLVGGNAIVAEGGIGVVPPGLTIKAVSWNSTVRAAAVAKKSPVGCASGKLQPVRAVMARITSAGSHTRRDGMVISLLLRDPG